MHKDKRAYLSFCNNMASVLAYGTPVVPSKSI